MLKKMRRRFILAAMTAVFTIVAMLSVCVCIWFYQSNVNQLDNTLRGILVSELHQRDPFADGFPGGDGRASSERPYMTRFFSVTFSDTGTVSHTSRDYIASVSDEEAVQYAETAVARGREFGFYKGYRYIVSQGEIVTAVFLNAEFELSLQRALIVGCAAVSLFCMALAFVIILLLSKRALDPYMRNIEQQKQFITDAGHELKTPLTAIAASADVLAMDDENNEWVQNIQLQVQRLAKLVNALVTLSRLDEEQPLPEQTDFVLSDVIWEIAEPMRSLAEAKGKTFTQNIEDGMRMHGDSASIGQLVSILLDNALKYSSPGGEIRLAAFKRHRENIIEVSNPCALMDTEHIDRLFDRFYRPDESRAASTGGTGIGLSIARAITEAHSGTIAAESADGTSITFRVKLRAI